MEKVLRIIKAEGKTEWVTLPETTILPRKGESVVVNQELYTVLYVEHNFDSQAIFIVVK